MAQRIGFEIDEKLYEFYKELPSDIKLPFNQMKGKILVLDSDGEWGWSDAENRDELDLMLYYASPSIQHGPN